MLGKLAKYLRIAGIDAEYSRAITRPRLIKTAEEEHRILLTRRREMVDFNISAPCYFINSNYPPEQFQEVLSHFNISSDISQFFTLCLQCNRPLIKIDKTVISGKVPEYVFITINDFSQCPCCKKIYWKGTHYNNMVRRLNRLISQSNVLNST